MVPTWVRFMAGRTCCPLHKSAMMVELRAALGVVPVQQKLSRLSVWLIIYNGI
jgi:hypothetical protein